ncbi:MAG: hypothetical protein H2045_05560 [Rhizobiales bacterium]|nr:hypothetical protein [Hyphomicrobiales bacterium]
MTMNRQPCAARFLLRLLCGVVTSVFLVACGTTTETPETAAVTGTADPATGSAVETAALSSPASTVPSDDAACPPIQILEGTGALVAYADPKSEDAANIDHQATIIRSGRNCRLENGTLTLRVGTGGRVAKGPKSAGDSVTLPIRIVVLRGEKEVLFSKLYSQFLPLNSSAAQDFSLVEEAIALPVKTGENLKILVGFDTLGQS